MKLFKTLLIAGIFLGTTFLGTSLVLNQIGAPTVVYAEEDISIEDESQEISEEETGQYAEILEELENLINEKTNEIWNKELVSGLTIGGAIIFAMEFLLVIFRSRFNKKKDTSYEERFKELQNKFHELTLKSEEIAKVSEEYISKGCDEMNAIKGECSSLLKQIKNIVPELKKYEQFNQKLVTVINILDTMSFSPENVKNGVSEKVKGLIEEVK